MKLRGQSGKIYTLTKELSRGGQGVVYLVEGQPNLLAKYYLATARTPETKILAMVANPPGDPTATTQNHISISWPREPLYEGKQLVGFIMPRVVDAVPFLNVYNPVLRSRLPWKQVVDWRFLHRTARNYASAVSAIHSKGYVIGDINEGNVLVKKNALISIIDTDSFQVPFSSQGRSSVFRCPVGREEFTPPELQGASFDRVDRAPNHDSFGMGVIFYLLLMNGGHPFRSEWKGKGHPPPQSEKIKRGLFPYQIPRPMDVEVPKNAVLFSNLHPELQVLFRECFALSPSGIQKRPTAEAWERALRNAETSLIKCPKGHWYSNHLGACPRCPASPSKPIRLGYQKPLKAPTQHNQTARTPRPLRNPATTVTRPPVTTTNLPPPPIVVPKSGGVLRSRIKLAGASLIVLVLSGWLLGATIGDDSAGSLSNTIPAMSATVTLVRDSAPTVKSAPIAFVTSARVFLRQSPRMSDHDDYILREGSRVEILEQDIINDGRVWVRVRESSTGREGYVPQSTVALDPSTGTSDTSVVVPTATLTDQQARIPSITNTRDTPTPIGNNGSTRDAVVTTERGMGTYLRQSPRMSDHDDYILREGSRVEILEQDIINDGRVWVRVRESSTGREGYVPQAFLIVVHSDPGQSPTIAPVN